jgi:hypothetical protein
LKRHVHLRNPANASSRNRASKGAIKRTGQILTTFNEFSDPARLDCRVHVHQEQTAEKPGGQSKPRNFQESGMKFHPLKTNDPPPDLAVSCSDPP